MGPIDGGPSTPKGRQRTPKSSSSHTRGRVPAVRHRMSAAVIRDEWLAGPTSATPNLKRLRDLLVLLHEIGPRDRIRDVEVEFRARASFDEFWRAKAEATISRLESESRTRS